MSDTPETDAEDYRICEAWSSTANDYYTMLGFARKLERERDEAIQARKVSAADWLNQIANADLRVTRIKRERDEARSDLAYRLEQYAIKQLQLSDARKTILELQKK